MRAFEETQRRVPGVAGWLRAMSRGALAVGLAMVAGLALRLPMLKGLGGVFGDSLLYGGLARNLLLHGRYALTGAGGAIYPTLIRLPGYPLFLAACFRVFGMENYFAAACVQVALDLAGCLLLAGFAWRMVRYSRPGNQVLARRAGMVTLWLAVLCPFTASYCATAMAESLSIFALALAMWAMARMGARPPGAVALPRWWSEGPTWTNALLFTVAVTWAALLRPDGALAAVAFTPALLVGARAAAKASIPSPAQNAKADGSERTKQPARARLARIALVCALLALAPFAVWTWRNWRVFHVFEPLAPRLATDPGEDPHLGWEHWVKSWCLDFVSTDEIYWNVPDDTLDIAKLPARAFDSPAQFAQTAALVRDYEKAGNQLTPQLDARFEKLAQERIAAHPLRYYVLLPVGRLADMWLRPRVENLPVDLDWWVYARHRAETVFAWFYAGLNGLYLLLAAIGLWLRPRFWKPLLAYMLLRSALLLTVEAPEARYTLECFPMIFALGGVAVAVGIEKLSKKKRMPVPAA